MSRLGIICQQSRNIVVLQYKYLPEPKSTLQSGLVFSELNLIFLQYAYKTLANLATQNAVVH